LDILVPPIQPLVSVPQASDTALPTKATRAGVAYGIAAYTFWGLAPIYFKAISIVPPSEVLAHRIVGAAILLAAFLSLTHRWGLVLNSLRSRQTRIFLLATTVLIGTNWFLFIWAVTNNLLLQASLGYYINPLVSILLGMVFLNERLSRWGKISVALAAVAVAFQVVQGAGVPYVALILACSFGTYGLLRKIVKVDAVVGLAVETSMLFPLAAGYLLWLGLSGHGSLGTISRQFDGLLLLAGAVTTFPLVWFTKAARRLRLSTIGFLQYIGPSLHFVLAVFVYGEAFSWSSAVTFCCIWVALTIYSIDATRRATI